jgi:hypothetical protein
MEPMTKEQLEFIKSEINRVYLFLLSNGDVDPIVIKLTGGYPNGRKS